jgi:hypothetical protein
MIVDMAHGNGLVELVSRLGPQTTTGLAILVAYIALCRSLRYRRRDQKHAEYPYKTREDFKKMTAEHAWEITKYVQGLEFPWTSGKALAFALFKWAALLTLRDRSNRGRTYGIPSISKLLCETQQLGKVDYAGRRYADTAILIIEFMAHSPASERANSAISRMNYLHGRYQKANKISNDDMLYTLSLFILEVDNWVERFEWRSLTPMEVCAVWVYMHARSSKLLVSYLP